MIYILLIIGIEALLFLTNYSYATYLVGWDTVMPEFNIALNFKRALFSIWQEYRGLGLLDGMAHSANLMHTVYIWILSVVIPHSALRYVFIILTHALGGVGMYLLTRRLTGKPTSAFLAALFYMFNIGVIQMYYAPLEVFSIHFAALPWLSLVVSRTLENPTRKRLAVLFLTSIAFSSQGFVPTIFIAFLVLFGFLLVFSFIEHRCHPGRRPGIQNTENWMPHHVRHDRIKVWVALKPILVVGFIVFASNAFWLMPYAYSAVKASPVIKNTRINQFSSEEIYYRNKARGDLFSVLSLKGFMLDANEYDIEKRGYVRFMETWKKHSSSLPYTVLFLGAVGVLAIGVWDVFKNRKRAYFSYVAAFCVSLLFLANNTIVFEHINTVIRTLFPILGEAFRFPFTKFIILFAFCYSVLLANGLSICHSWLDQESTRDGSGPRIKSGVTIEEMGNNKKPVWAQAIPFYICLVVIMFLSYPAFTGHFFSPYVKLSIPQEYFETISYFQHQDARQRIALLPTHTFWNWQYSDWGFRGSGFLWYGIPQPIVLRAFDPWSNYNEQFYNELSYAIQRKDSVHLEQVLRKYDISFLLLDQHIMNTLSAQAINYESLRQFLEDVPFLTQEKVYGKIVIYKTTFSPSLVYELAPTTPSVASGVSYVKRDSLFDTMGNYVEDSKSAFVSYVFPSLFTEKKQEDREFTAIQKDEHIIFAPKRIESFSGKKSLELPSLFRNEFLIPVEVTAGIDEIVLHPLYPEVYINDIQINQNVQPIVIKPTYVKNPISVEFVDINHTVNLLQGDRKSYLLNPYVNSIKLVDSEQEEIIVIDTKEIDNSPFQIPLEEEEIRSFRVEVPKIHSPFSMENVIQTKKYKTQKGVNTAPVVKDQKSYSNMNAREDGIHFEVRGDSAQLMFYKDNLFHDASYIVFAETEYTSGLPIGFYLDNPYELRAEIEAQLSKNENSQVIVIPPTENFFKGYGFHFTVKSVGTEIAKSTIRSIEMYPFPHEFLKHMRIIKNDYTVSAKELKKEKRFESSDPYMYTTTGEGNSYIGISQAYHEGWKGYRIEKGERRIENWFKTIFPFLFGEELKEHVKVNSWSNGWKVSVSQLSTLPSVSLRAGNSQLVLVFIPQYLEFLGFILGVVGVGAIFFLKPQEPSP